MALLFSIVLALVTVALGTLVAIGILFINHTLKGNHNAKSR